MDDFEIMTDSSSNLTPDLVREAQIDVIPLTCLTEAGEMPAYDGAKVFDGHSFYDKLRKTGPIKTSMINQAQFTQAFEPVIQAGKNILYLAMSSGISGTCAAAMQAAGELMKKYPGRVIRVVDTLAASFGEGIFALKASVMRSARASLEATADWAELNKNRMCQFFTVDDLMFLHKGGRISSLTARIGSIANIKPLLMGNSEGKIVSFATVRGRRKAIQMMAERYDALVRDPDQQTVGIAHADCQADVDYLIGLLNAKKPPREILTVMYEPVTGAHVGPETLALFFLADDSVRGANLLSDIVDRLPMKNIRSAVEKLPFPGRKKE